MEEASKTQKIEFEKPHVTQQAQESQGSKRTKVTFPGDRKKKKKKFNKLLAIVVIILIIVGVAALIYFKAGQGESEETTEELTPTVTEERPTSTPVPTIFVDKSEVSIQVLNGTGISGQAGYLQDKLEGLGYDSIEVGNADDDDYSETKVTFDENLPDEIKDEITDELKGIYQDVDFDTEDLDDFDIEIIAGLRKGQEFPTDAPKATKTPTPTEARSGTPTATPTPTNSPTPTP